jgi:O-antigen ligase/tetratricopeptide (TPR) repeat protein
MEAAGKHALNAPVSQPTTEARVRPSLVALLGWTAFIALLVYATFLGGGHAGIQISGLRAISLTLIAMGLGIWAVLAWRRPEWRPRTAIWPALVVPFLALAIATALSPYPRLGLDYLAWTALLIGLYLFLVRILAFPYARERIGSVIGWLALLMGVVYIGIVVAHWFEWWALLGRFTPPMLRPAYTHLFIGGPTVVAPVMALMASAAVGGLASGTRAQRWLGIAVVAVSAVVIVLAGTRASWLAAAVALVIVGIGGAIAHRDRLGHLVADRRARAIVAGAAVLGGLGALVLGPTLAERLVVSGDGGRLMYFATAWRMFESSPLTGLGPGNWAAQRPAFTRADEPDIYVPHAHDIYLQTLAESGILGAVAGLVAVGAMLWLLRGALRGADPVRRPWAWAAIFSLVYLGVHCLVDWYANVPLIIMLVAIPVAALDATSERSLGLGRVLADGVPRSLRAIGTIALVVGSVIAIGFLLRTETTEQMNAAAVAAIEEARWQDAAEPALAAAVADPGMVPYQMNRGLAAAGTADWETAEAAFTSAAEVDDLPQNWLNAALARVETGRPGDAAEAIERALRLGRQNPSIQLAAAFLQDRLGDDQAADDAYAAVLAERPSVAADPFWRAGEFVGGRFERLVDQAVERSEAPWEVALMAGDLERARALTRQAADPSLATQVVEAWAGSGDGPDAARALAGIQRAATATPERQDVVAWAARLSARAGDAKQAARFRRIAEFDNESFVPLGYEMRVWFPGTDMPDGAQPSAFLYGEHMFRRSTPGELLATGLPTLVQVDLAAEPIVTGLVVVDAPSGYDRAVSPSVPAAIDPQPTLIPESP